jgi:hypothetical protein
VNRLLVVGSYLPIAWAGENRSHDKDVRIGMEVGLASFCIAFRYLVPLLVWCIARSH